MQKNNPFLKISEIVQKQLLRRKAVVALESTIISHGMPYPQNLECALQVEATVRASGATPATIALLDGYIKVGLDESELMRLARAGPQAVKNKPTRFNTHLDAH